MNIRESQLATVEKRTRTLTLQKEMTNSRLMFRLFLFIEHLNLLGPKQEAFSYTKTMLHGELLYKFEKLGIRGNCLGWIANFIHNPSICVSQGSHPISNTSQMQFREVPYSAPSCST
jgi:hypothetical protein